jgi:hypothetical protein
METETTRQAAVPFVRLTWTAGVLAALLVAALLLGAEAARATAPVSPAPAALEDEEGPASEEGGEEGEEEAEAEEGEGPWGEEGPEWGEEPEWEEEPGWEEPDWEAEGWEAEELGGTDCELGYEALEEGLLTPTDVQDLCAAEEEWIAEAEGRLPRKAKARPSCALRGVRARVLRRRNRLRLFVGYATAAPTRARIEVRAGKRRIATVKRRLGRKGVIRLSKRVGRRLGRQLSRRGAGGRVRLRIELPRGAAACPARRLALFARR